MTVTLYTVPPIEQYTAHGYTITQAGTPVADNDLWAVRSTALAAGIILNSAPGGAPQLVQVPSYYSGSTGAPSGDTLAPGTEVRDSSGAVYNKLPDGTWVAVGASSGGSTSVPQSLSNLTDVNTNTAIAPSSTSTVLSQDTDGVWKRQTLTIGSGSGSSGAGSGAGVTDVSSFSGYDPTGATPSNTALTAALTAVANGSSKTLLFTGTPLFTQPTTITTAMRGMTFRGTGGAGAGLGTTLYWGGTGAMFTLGSDTHPNDRAGVYYDGPQSFYLENLTITPKASLITASMPNGASYAPGTTCIRDWYGGDVRLANVIIRNFDTGFEGHQSDINNWWNVAVLQCNLGLYLETRSDQFHASGLYQFQCNRAMDLRGVIGARFYACQWVGNGHSTMNSITIRQSADIAQGCSGISFDDCWFEHFQGYSSSPIEAFVEIGVGDTATSSNIHFRNPNIGTRGVGFLPHTQHLVKVGNGTAISIENPSWTWYGLDKLVKCVGSTSPAIKISAAPTTATAYGVLNAGTGSPAFTDNRWAGGGTVSTS